MSHEDIDVNAKDEDGCVALHWANRTGHIECCKELLEHKDIDVNVKNYY
jgi:ankyrin repeat protein